MTNGVWFGVIGLLSLALWLLLLAKLFLCIMIFHVYHRCYGIQRGRALASSTIVVGFRNPEAGDGGKGKHKNSDKASVRCIGPN